METDEDFEEVAITARGVKRQGDVVDEHLLSKIARLDITQKGQSETCEKSAGTEINPAVASSTSTLNEFLELQCVEVAQFKQNMFNTCFGKLVLLIRPWTSKNKNIQASCQACQVPMQSTYGDHMYTIRLSNKILAQASGLNEQKAKQDAEELAWQTLKEQVISVLVKEQCVAQDDTRIGEDLSGNEPPAEALGTATESSGSSKMCQMGCAGGRLGADAQGITGPSKPHLQKMNSASFGSTFSHIHTFEHMAASLMKNFIASSSQEDLVFSSNFNKEERDILRQYAHRNGLTTTYRTNKKITLVVKKNQDPFSIVQEVIKEGGNTAKYQVFIPVALASKCQP